MIIKDFAFLLQIKGTSGLLSKITFSSDDHDFLHKRQQALEVSNHVSFFLKSRMCCTYAALNSGMIS